MAVGKDFLEKISKVYDQFTEIKIKLDYLQMFVDKSISGFESDLKDLTKRLDDYEKQSIYNHTEVLAEIKNMQGQFDMINKQALFSAIQNITPETVGQYLISQKPDEVKKLLGHSLLDGNDQGGKTTSEV